MTVLYQGDETQHGYGFPDGVAAKDPSRYGTATDPLGQYPAVWRCEVHPGDSNVQGSGSGERCEGLVTVGDVGAAVRGIEGRTLFYSWDVIFDTGFPPNSSDWNTTGQWHNSGTTGATCSVVVPSGKMTLLVGANDANVWQTVRHQLVSLVPGVRYELAVMWTWSSDPTLGAVKAWLDGAEVVPLTPCKTLYTGQTTYPKLGYYRNAQASVARLFYHGYRISTSLADAVGSFPASVHRDAWDSLIGTQPQPPPPARPIHDAVEQISATANPRIRHALDLIADKIEP